MKVKSILNVSSATRINIMVPREDGKLFDYDIDYLRERNDYAKYGSWCALGSEYGVPDKVINAEVEMISIDHCTSALRIYVKGVTV